MSSRRGRAPSALAAATKVIFVVATVALRTILAG